MDGDGQAELIGRSASGIEVWKLDKKTSQWVELAPNAAKVPFPPFEGTALSAYDYISTQVLGDSPQSQPSLRANYGSMTANAASNHSKSITNLTRPAQFSEELWAVVTNQLQHELSCVGAVQTYISQSNTVINDILPYKTAIVKEVAASVDASDDPSSDIAVTLASMVLGIVNAVAIPLSDGAGLAAGVLASILGPAMASLPGSGTDAVHTEVHKLDDWLETQFKKSLTANSDYVNQILGTSDHLGDWGLLQTLGTLSSDGGPYQLQDNYINDAVFSATEPLKLWAYQALMPVKYQIWYLPDQPAPNPDDPFSPVDNSIFGPGVPAPDYAWWARDQGNGDYTYYAVLHPGNDGCYPPSSCMGEIWKLTSKEDFFLGNNGWNTMTRVQLSSGP